MVNKIPDWQKKRNQSIKLYAKVVKAVRKEFKSQKKELSYAEARSFASDKVYPQFKGQPPYKVKVKDIREATRNAIEPPVVEPILFADPRTIGEEEISGVTWFDLDKFLSGDIQPSIRSVRALRNNTKDLRLMVLAGEYGNTGEFNLSDYEYVSTGLQEIIETIRENSPAVGNEPYLTWEGYVGLRQGATDLNDPNSYVLQLILIENNNPVVEPSSITTLPPQRIQSKEDFERLAKEQRERLKDERTRQKEQDELAKLQGRKKTVRPTTKQRIKEPKVSTPAPIEPMPKRLTKAQQVVRLNEIKLRELELLRAEYDDEIISKGQYRKQKARIMSNYEESFKKLRTGGIV